MDIREIAIDTTITNISKLAVVAGFSPRTGLYNGRMGTIITLYSGSAYFDLPDVAAIADNLLEDLLDDIQYNDDLGFSSGLTGIGWGINYLIKNKFIEAEPDFFKDIDDHLSNKLSIEVFGLEEYLLVGLYLLSRIENNSDNNCINFCIKRYLNEVIGMLEKGNASLDQASLFLPFWYCLGNMDVDLLSDEHLKQFVSANDPDTTINRVLNERYQNVGTVQDQEIPFTTINRYCFDRMILRSKSSGFAKGTNQ
jgi:hypothetical protein